MSKKKNIRNKAKKRKKHETTKQWEKKMKTLKITHVKYTHTHILPMGRAIRV